MILGQAVPSVNNQPAQPLETLTRALDTLEAVSAQSLETPLTARALRRIERALRCARDRPPDAREDRPLRRGRDRGTRVGRGGEGVSALSFLETILEPAPTTGREAQPGLVYELQPGHVEGWERLEIIHTKGGQRVLEQGHNYRYVLEVTPFVLESLVRALEAITARQLENHLATIGPRGARILEKKRGRAA